MLYNSLTTSQHLETKIKENIDFCTGIGLNIKAIVCDQASNNRSVFKRLGVTCDKPYFEYKSQRIYAIFDIPYFI